jgi:hypothetical protein
MLNLSSKLYTKFGTKSTVLGKQCAFLATMPAPIRQPERITNQVDNVIASD